MKDCGNMDQYSLKDKASYLQIFYLATFGESVGEILAKENIAELSPKIYITLGRPNRQL